MVVKLCHPLLNLPVRLPYRRIVTFSPHHDIFDDCAL